MSGDRVTDRRADDAGCHASTPVEGDEEAPPEDQRTQLSSGDPLAPTDVRPASAATSGDPLRAAADLARRRRPPRRRAEQADAAARAADRPRPPTPATPPRRARPTSRRRRDAPQRPPAEPQPTVADPPVEPATAAAGSGDPLATPRADRRGRRPSRAEGEQAPADARPRFRERTRMRRRLRYLRRLRELAFRDLGGLVFDLHRFGRERDDLVAAKLEALRDHRPRAARARGRAATTAASFTDLREAGIAACPRCGTLHDTDANFCPGCGTSLRSAIVRDAAPVTRHAEPAASSRPPPQTAQQPPPAAVSATPPDAPAPAPRRAGTIRCARCGADVPPDAGLVPGVRPRGAHAPRADARAGASRSSSPRSSPRSRSPRSPSRSST